MTVDIDFINVYSLPKTASSYNLLNGIVHESLNKNKEIKTKGTEHYLQFDPSKLILQGQNTLSGENYYHSIKDTPNSWVEIQFQEEWIIPTAFVIADSGNIRRLRSWNIEGSQNGYDYDVLDRHLNDSLFHEMWQIEPFLIKPKKRKPYRIFRIQQTGVMSEGSGPLRVGRLEIYGIVAFCKTICTNKPPQINWFLTCERRGYFHIKFSTILCCFLFS